MAWTNESLPAHVKAWQECKLPLETWAPHESHVATTVRHLRHNQFAEALQHMRKGILAYNSRKGIADRYHETITVVYTHLINAAYKRQNKGQKIGALANAVIAGKGTSREHRRAMFQQHYSNPDALWAKGSESRTRFIPPDLKPLQA